MICSRRSVAAIGLSVLMAVSAACGKGSESDNAAKEPGRETTTAAKDEPTTTVKPTTTTTTIPPNPKADEATIDLALAGTFHADEFPPPWKQYDEAGATKVDPKSCSYRPGGPEATLATGAGQQGVHMQYGDKSGFLLSKAFAFPDVAAANAWLEVIKSDEWAECQRKVFESVQSEADFDGTVRLVTREAPGLGSAGFVAYASFGAVEKGQKDPVLFTDLSYYIVGRVVIELGVDLGDSDPAVGQAMSDLVDPLIGKVYDRLYAAQPGA